MGIDLYGVIEAEIIIEGAGIKVKPIMKAKIVEPISAFFLLTLMEKGKIDGERKQ